MNADNLVKSRNNTVFRAELENKAAFITRQLAFYIPSDKDEPQLLHAAMRYGVLEGGKRLRPVLCLASAEAAGGSLQEALFPALALEVIHAYSLIHDDLPCMDDDDLRRGKPSCHIAFGQANAILAGDALLTLAFEWVANARVPSTYSPTALVTELAKAAGSYGIVGGQTMDLAAEGAKPAPRMVNDIHGKKTASLFRAAVRMGAITAGVTAEELNAFSSYGTEIGKSFQIVDDILNVTSSREKLGKAAGSDNKREKMTYVSLYGIDRAKQDAVEFTEQAISSIQDVRPRADFLIWLARTMLARAG